MAADVLFLLEELCSHVSLALAEGYGGTGSERSRDVPDVRTVRYYTTLGLLDRPAAMRGRKAQYGRKHLLQLVAIKRLQAKGLSLVEVQGELLGKTERQLERLAQLPADFDKTLEPVIRAAEEETAEAAAPERGRAFWKAEPTLVPEREAANPPTATLQGVPLADGATLLLAAPRALEETDLEGLHAAAQPLLRWLQRRRLLPGE